MNLCHRQGGQVAFRTVFRPVLCGLAMNVGITTAVTGACVAWTKVNVHDHWTPRSGHTSVVFDNKIWVLGGKDDQGTKSDVWCSSNGENWVLTTEEAGWPSRCEHSSVVFKNKLWVLGGLGQKNDVWSSADGILWSRVTESAPWPGRSQHTSFVFDDKIWVLGGSDGDRNVLPSIYYNDVWYSGDGVNWSSATLEAPWTGRNDHSAVVSSGKVWVIGGTGEAVGNDEIAALSDAWYSEDGATWSRATSTAPWINRTGHTSVASGGGFWLLGGFIDRGFAGPVFKNDAWFSTNGMDWTLICEEADWPPREGHTSIFFKGKLWLLGGYGEEGSRLNDVWYSNLQNASTDLNGDGITNLSDLLILVSQWQAVD